MTVRRLVVAEKYNTAMRIATILSGGKPKRESVEKVPIFRFARDGDEYITIGLRGHILELDYPKKYKRWKSTDLRELVWAEPVPKATASNFVHALIEVSKGVEEVVIATDYDREGELIGVEALDIVKQAVPEVRIKRARFSALTKSDIEGAFANLVDVDYNLADAAASRQLIDLAWGAALTRFISLASGQVGRDFLSIGRVQSPTLALIVDRQREIEGFQPKPFWTLEATLDKGGQFTAEHERGRFWEHQEAQTALQRAQGAATARVLGFESREKVEKPPVPFSTTHFLTEATKLGLSAYQAMGVAESLYNEGYISYPRTDNTTYPPSLGLRGVLTKLQGSEFGSEVSELLQREELRATRGKTSTTDHPPIYPTEVANRAKLRADKWRVYELVVRRFMATLAPDCVLDTVEGSLDLNGEVFLAEGQKVREPGWRKYYPYLGGPKEAWMPALAEGEEVRVMGVEEKQHETKPPPGYSQGTLIQEMERLGLGTKSTRHEMIQKLYVRKYIDGKQILPTAAGKAVIAALETHAKDITQAEMTATLELHMEAIANRQKDKEEVVAESQDMLDGVVKQLQRNEKAIGGDIQTALREQAEIGPCGVCGGGTLMLRRSRRGSTFIGCSNYPKCKATYTVPHGGKVEPSKTTCTVCNMPLVKMIQGRQEIELCFNHECPTVAARNRVGTCPRCGRDLVVRQGRAGKRFVGCTGYPDCNQSYPLPQRGLFQPTNTTCQICDSPLVQIVGGRGKPWIICINMDCPSKKERAAAKAEAVAAPSK